MSNLESILRESNEKLDQDTFSSQDLTNLMRFENKFKRENLDLKLITFLKKYCQKYPCSKDTSKVLRHCYNYDLSKNSNLQLINLFTPYLNILNNNFFSRVKQNNFKKVYNFIKGKQSFQDVDILSKNLIGLTTNFHGQNKIKKLMDFVGDNELCQMPKILFVREQLYDHICMIQTDQNRYQHNLVNAYLNSRKMQNEGIERTLRIKELETKLINTDMPDGTKILKKILAFDLSEYKNKSKRKDFKQYFNDFLIPFTNSSQYSSSQLKHLSNHFKRLAQNKLISIEEFDYAHDEITKRSQSAKIIAHKFDAYQLSNQPLTHIENVYQEVLTKLEKMLNSSDIITRISSYMAEVYFEEYIQTELNLFLDQAINSQKFALTSCEHNKKLYLDHLQSYNKLLARSFAVNQTLESGLTLFKSTEQLLSLMIDFDLESDQDFNYRFNRYINLTNSLIIMNSENKDYCINKTAELLAKIESTSTRSKLFNYFIDRVGEKSTGHWTL